MDRVYSSDEHDFPLYEPPFLSMNQILQQKTTKISCVECIPWDITTWHCMCLQILDSFLKKTLWRHRHTGNKMPLWLLMINKVFSKNFLPRSQWNVWNYSKEFLCIILGSWWFGRMSCQCTHAVYIAPYSVIEVYTYKCSVVEVYLPDLQRLHFLFLCSLVIWIL